MDLSSQYERYQRQIILPEFGEATQQKLLAAKVLVAGAGGLGCPVLQYLTAAGIGTLGIADLHLDKGIIYSVSPNPFSGEILINYGVFTGAKVNIQIIDINGNVVSSPVEKWQDPKKYVLRWKTPENLASGIYWIALKVNDLQVHYTKVIKL